MSENDDTIGWLSLLAAAAIMLIVISLIVGGCP
jgi:hypothetical protein